MKLSNKALDEYYKYQKNNEVLRETDEHDFLNWLNEEVDCPHNRWEEDYEYNYAGRSIPMRCVYCKSRYNTDKITRYKLYEVE